MNFSIVTSVSLSISHRGDPPSRLATQPASRLKSLTDDVHTLQSRHDVGLLGVFEVIVRAHYHLEQIIITSAGKKWRNQVLIKMRTTHYLLHDTSTLGLQQQNMRSKSSKIQFFMQIL